MNSGIYALVNMATGKKYVGRTTDFSKRERTHFWMLEKNRHPNSHLQRAWNNGERFTFQILERCEPDKCNEQEIYWIEKLDTIKKGYNQCEGGQATTGYHFTEEQRRRISENRKGIPRSREAIERSRETFRERMESDPEFAAEYRQKLSQASKGRKPWNDGRPHTEEEKRHLSEVLTGRHISSEQKQKLRELNSGENSIIAKLTKRDVVEIRYRFLSGDRQIDIAKDYPVTPQTIYDIVHNRRWKSVPNTLEELEDLR